MNDHSDTVGFRVLGKQDVAQAASLLAAAFAHHDPLAVALQISSSEMREMIVPLLEASLGDELSVVAYDQSQPDKILGCVLAKNLGSDNPAQWSKSIVDRFSAVFGLIDELHQRYFQNQGPENMRQFVHESMVATDTRAAGRGVAQGLLKASAMNGRTKGYTGAVAELTGPISQHVFINKHGYQPVAAVSYRSFSFGGAEPFRSIGGVDSCVLAIKNYDH
ncbi:MAG: hypothetical protein FJ146_08520 [Deltaproteobacteria bacterium]|nr:hypothetical protein [Deltaproteobacteria bacterium]